MTDYGLPLNILLGDRARRVPAWLYVQDQGYGLVSFIGGSRVEPTRVVDADGHPLRYGSRRTHQLIVGELIVRPNVVVATDALKGYGLPGLISHPEGGPKDLAARDDGEYLLGGDAI